MSIILTHTEHATLIQQLAEYHRMAQSGLWISNEEYWSLCRQKDRIAELNAALKDMVNAWEPDGDGSDRRMWQRAKDLLWTTPDGGEKHE